MNTALKRIASAAAKPVGIAVGAAGAAMLIRVALGASVSTPVALQAGLAVIALLCGGLMALRQRHHWTLPAAQLLRLTGQARRGETTIDDLSSVGGGMSGLAGEIQELLRELRHRQAIIVSMEVEMRQRVANRTDALERKLGTLEQQAKRDPLTGLLNRREFDAALQAAIAGDTDENRLCLLMIDVDHFKLLNDTKGHPAGDDFLRNIGQIIRSSLRPSDRAFRLGGDEFAIVTVDVTREGAEALADRLRSLVSHLARPLKLTWPPALSIGIATLAQADRRTTEAWVEAADKVLYEVKARRPGPRRVA